MTCLLILWVYNLNTTFSLSFLLFFPTAVQEERGPLLTKENKLSSRCTKSTASMQLGQTTPKNVSTSGMPFPFCRLSYMPVHMVNRKFNFDIKRQVTSASILEMLAKTEKAENNVVPLTPSLSDRTTPKNTRRSFLSVVSWAKEIPMFTQLPVEDQIELIKTTWSEVNTLELMYHVATDNIDFQTDDLDHLYLTDNQAIASEEIIKECVASMKVIQLDKSELSYLKLITLMNPCEC